MLLDDQMAGVDVVVVGVVDVEIFLAVVGEDWVEFEEVLPAGVV